MSHQQKLANTYTNQQTLAATIAPVGANKWNGHFGKLSEGFTSYICQELIRAPHENQDFQGSPTLLFKIS